MNMRAKIIVIIAGGVVGGLLGFLKARRDNKKLAQMKPESVKASSTIQKPSTQKPRRKKGDKKDDAMNLKVTKENSTGKSADNSEDKSVQS